MKTFKPLSAEITWSTKISTLDILKDLDEVTEEIRELQKLYVIFQKESFLIDFDDPDDCDCAEWRSDERKFYYISQCGAKPLLGCDSLKRKMFHGKFKVKEKIEELCQEWFSMNEEKGE